MAELPKDGDSEPMTESDETTAPAAPAPKRGPGHRAADARDTAAEMAARAHEISLEAGSRMSGVMREVIGAAAGLSEFAIESTRDLIHYMVRRGQMTRFEGDALIEDAEQAYIAKHGALPKPEPKPAPPKPIPLGQLPKAVSAPAKAAEAALEARAALRVKDPRPAGKPLIEVTPKPLGKATPVREVSVDGAAGPAAKAAKSTGKAAKGGDKSADKGADKPTEKAAAKPALAKTPAKAAKAPAKPAAKPAAKAPAKEAPKKAAKPAAKPAAKSPAKSASKPAAKTAKTAKAPAKAAAKAPVKAAAKAPAKAAAKAPAKAAAKAPAKAAAKSAKAARTTVKKSAGKKR